MELQHNSQKDGKKLWNIDNVEWMVKSNEIACDGIFSFHHLEEVICIKSIFCNSMKLIYF